MITKLVCYVMSCNVFTIWIPLRKWNEVLSSSQKKIRSAYSYDERKVKKNNVSCLILQSPQNHQKKQSNNLDSAHPGRQMTYSVHHENSDSEIAISVPCSVINLHRPNTVEPVLCKHIHSDSNTCGTQQLTPVTVHIESDLSLLHIAIFICKFILFVC